MYCAHCGTNNGDELESCDRCGELLARTDSSHVTHLGIKACPDCKTVNAPRARFCTDCGRNLDDVIATSGATRQAPPARPAAPIGTRRSPVSPTPPAQRDPGPPNRSAGEAEVRRPAAAPPPSSVSTEGVRAGRGPEDLRADSTDSGAASQAPNDSGTPEANLPEELKGWNWGGLLLPFVWGPFNRVWLGLAVVLVFIPPMSDVLVLLLYGPAAIFVGMRGNELAWRARKWDSIEQFRAVQAQWARWGMIGFGLLAISMLMFLTSNGG